MADISKTECPENTTDPASKVFGHPVDVSELNRLHDDTFITILDLPKCLKELNYSVCGEQTPASLDSMELNVRTINIPSISINKTKHSFGSGSYVDSNQKLVDFEDVTIQFKVDAKLYNYQTIYRWLNMLVNFEEGTSGGVTKEKYQTTYSVFLMDQYKKPIGLFTYHGVIPVTLGSISLDNTTTGNPLFIDFTFAFDYLTFDLREDFDK